MGLRLAEKPDSQEICFIPGGDYKQFLTAYLEEQGEAVPETAGELVAASGEVVGRHEGIFNFTVGQRKGLGVASPSPLYVLQYRSGEPPRDRGRGCRAGDADAARPAAELDQHCGADGADAGAGEDPAPARAGLGDAGAGGCGRGDGHLRRAAARRDAGTVGGVLRRR